MTRLSNTLIRHDADSSQNEHLMSHRLISVIPFLRQFASTRKLSRSKIYAGIRKEVEDVLCGHECGFYAEAMRSTRRPFVRAILWNLNNGHHYEGIIETLRNHPLISTADVLIFPGVDIGMPRTDFRNIARSLALEFGMNYAFVPSYLCVGACNESALDVSSARRALFLEGNAILSRRPIRHVRSLPLPVCRDPMKNSLKRLGSQKLLLVDLDLGGADMTLAAVHLDTFSSPRQRSRQLALVAREALKAAGDRPLLLAGDLNTCAFNTRFAFTMMCGFFNKILRGADYILEEHLPYPERHFDACVFEQMIRHGLNYESVNAIGAPTLPFKEENAALYDPVHELMPLWAQPILKKIMARYGGKAGFKPDWFVAGPRIRVSTHPQSERPKVISNLYFQNLPVSTHDAVLLDFEIT